MKLWIGRTEAIIPDDVYESVVERHPEKRIVYTKLYVFYDKPSDKEFDTARIVCEVPNYMFPEIGEGECVEFKSTVKL
jgi:hypothetical protein